MRLPGPSARGRAAGAGTPTGGSVASPPVAVAGVAKRPRRRRWRPRSRHCGAHPPGGKVGVAGKRAEEAAGAVDGHPAARRPRRGATGRRRRPARGRPAGPDRRGDQEPRRRSSSGRLGAAPLFWISPSGQDTRVRSCLPDKQCSTQARNATRVFQDGSGGQSCRSLCSPVVKFQMNHRIRRNSNNLLSFCSAHVFVGVGFSRLILMSRRRLRERASVWIGDGSIIAVAEMISRGFTRKNFDHGRRGPTRKRKGFCVATRESCDAWGHF